MPTPHYVAKKVGDQYVMVRSYRVNAANDGLELLVGGAALVLAGLGSRGTVRLAMVGLGSGVLALWASRLGHAAALGGTGDRRAGPITHGPSFPRDPSTGGATASHGQRPQDAVDEASMESFPASDPPAHMTPTHVI